MRRALLLGDTVVRACSLTPAARAAARLLTHLGSRLDPTPESPGDLVLTADSTHGRPTARVSITAFGLEGPYVDGHLAPPPYALNDPPMVALTAAHGALVALALLQWSRRHGAPASAEVAALEVQAACLGDLLPAALCARPQPARRGAAGRIVILRCADGFVGVSGLTAEHRSYLAAMAGIEPRALAHGDIAAALAPWARVRTRMEIVDAAQLWRLPVVPALSPDEVVADPQCTARGTWVHDATGHLTAGSPFRVTLCAAPTPLPPNRRPARRPARALPRATPLTGIRVLDLGSMWAGPYAGRLLAALGAEVIKVEAPRRPDGTRRPGDGGECTGVFGDLNCGKSSLTLDLHHPAGRELFLGLAARADIVLENYSPRVMPNFGLDYAVLSQVNPCLIMLSMPAFGSDGPWAPFVAYGSGLELATGLAWRRGAPGAAPRVAPAPYLDYLAGACGAVALVAALLAREHTGVGCHVEVAQRDVACQVLELMAAPQPPGSAPHRARAADLALERLARDPHLRARGLFVIEDTRGAICQHLARPPWRLQGAGVREERPAPAFGEDTHHVLHDLLHLDRAAIDRLVESGVVTIAPTPALPQRGREQWRVAGGDGAREGRRG